MKNLVRQAHAIFEPQRLSIIKLLQDREMCVCELAEVLRLSSPRMSQHLGILRQAGLVKERRSGKWVYYRLNNKAVGSFSQAWAEFFDGAMKETAGMKIIVNRLEKLDLDKIRGECEELVVKEG